MKPTLFHLGANLPIHSYGFLIALGLVVGVVLAVRRGRTVGIEAGLTLDLTFYAIVVGLVGARLLYVGMNAGDYLRLCRGSGRPRSLGQSFSDCTAALQFWQGGLVFLGGAALAAIVVLLFARRAKLPLGDVADVLAPSVSMAHVFGRIGCFLVGCCYGKACAFGVHFPQDSVAYTDYAAKHALPSWGYVTPGLHPTQLYEAAGELVIFLLLTRLWRHRRFPGAIALSYAMAYGVLRFLVEMLRGDTGRGYLVELRLSGLAMLMGVSPKEPLFLSTAQATVVLLAIGAAIAYRFLGRRSGRRDV
jgi:phosphatidylglycerol:prolipoprotein diacylglycerol transferase